MSTEPADRSIQSMTRPASYAVALLHDVQFGPATSSWQP